MKKAKLNPTEQLARLRFLELQKMLEGREPSQVLKYLLVWHASPYDVKTFNRFKKAIRAVLQAMNSEKPRPDIAKPKGV